MARAARRRQAEEALAFERDRAEALRDEIERLAADLEGQRVDEEAFARMAPEDAALVRTVIQPPDLPDDEFAADETWELYEDEPVAGEQADPRAEIQDEIARLEEEAAACSRLQTALEQYLEALNARVA